MAKSVPFKTSEKEGLAQAEGIVSFFDDAVVIQYETKDAFFGVVKSGLQEIEIPLDVIEEAELKKGLFRTRLCISVSDMDYCIDAPGNSANLITLPIRKRDRETAGGFIRALRLRISELEYEQALDDL